MSDILGKAIRRHMRETIGDASACPACNVTWDGDDIFEHFMATGRYTRENAEDVARNYGWTPENKRCFKINMVVIDASRYGGVSYYRCTSCESTWDRFTGERV